MNFTTRCAGAFAIFILLLLTGLRSSGAVIGTNVPSRPLTAERVAGLPAWQTYLDASTRQRQADQDFLRAEMATHGIKTGIQPPSSKAPTGTPLDQSASWYAGTEAQRIADCVITYQTPAGGWSKHTDYTKHPRAPGELFASDNNSQFIISNDFDAPTDLTWNYIGTLDNDATYTELNFLALVITANPKNNAVWRQHFLHGLDYLFAAQYPNGGWPQVWPLQGGYHDNITLNDDAMIHAIELLSDVSHGNAPFAFVPSDIRARAGAAANRGIDCLMAAQIRVHDNPTIWCQQYDALTLAPASARNYEMPSQSSAESAKIVLFLMELPAPDAKVVASVHTAAAWFKKTEIEDMNFKRIGAGGRRLRPAPGSGPIWPRYTGIGTDRPIFGDRDKSIHDNVDDLTPERRNGYRWYDDTPKRVLEHYRQWSQQHPQAR